MDFTEIRRDDGILVLKLEGRMDIDGAEDVGKRLIAATSGRGMRVIADLAEVNFMSSVGIGLIVRLAHSVREHHGNLVLLDPQSVVWLVLTKTRIPDIITVHLTLEEALKAVWEEPPKLAGEKP
jgi:anti-sigma B factor antagonist